MKQIFKIFSFIVFIFFVNYNCNGQYYSFSKERVKLFIDNSINETYLNVYPDEILADYSLEYNDFIYISNLLSTDIALEYFEYLYKNINENFIDANSFTFIYKIGNEPPIKYHFMMDKKTGEKVLFFYKNLPYIDNNGKIVRDKYNQPILKGIARFHLSESEIKTIRDILIQRFN